MIYIGEDMKRHLLDLSMEESRKKGKRVGMAELIREALVEYLRNRGRPVDSRESIKNRMLRTKGALGEDFARRVKRIGKEYDKWTIESV